MAQIVDIGLHLGNLVRRLLPYLPALTAVIPWALGIVALAHLRPPPEPTSPHDRRLILYGPPHTASDFPGRAAIDWTRLTTKPELASLPFDELLVTPPLGTSLLPELERAGFRAVPEFEGLLRFRGPEPWNLADTWRHWRPRLDTESGEPDTCTTRLEDGGRRCSDGASIHPDLVGRTDTIFGAVTIRSLPDGHRLVLRSIAAPPRLRGEVFPLAAGSMAAVTLRRGDDSRTTQCDELCPLDVPPGTGPLDIEIDGPALAVAIRLEAEGAQP